MNETLQNLLDHKQANDQLKILNGEEEYQASRRMAYEFVTKAIKMKDKEAQDD